MKRFLITLFISGIILLGVWVGPELNKEKQADSVEKVEALNPFEHQQAYQEPNLLSLDTVPIEGIVSEGTVIEPPQMALMSEPKKEVDWQGLITWIIGSLNGLFGLALLVKKVFFKT